MQGYHLRYSDEKPNQVIKQWPVEKLVVSKQQTKRHEVRAKVMKFSKLSSPGKIVGCGVSAWIPGGGEEKSFKDLS